MKLITIMQIIVMFFCLVAAGSLYKFVKSDNKNNEIIYMMIGADLVCVFILLFSLIIGK